MSQTEKHLLEMQTRPDSERAAGAFLMHVICVHSFAHFAHRTYVSLSGSRFANLSIGKKRLVGPCSLHYIGFGDVLAVWLYATMITTSDYYCY